MLLFRDKRRLTSTKVSLATGQTMKALRTLVQLVNPPTHIPGKQGKKVYFSALGKEIELDENDYTSQFINHQHTHTYNITKSTHTTKSNPIDTLRPGKVVNVYLYVNQLCMCVYISLVLHNFSCKIFYWLLVCTVSSDTVYYYINGFIKHQT